MTKQPSIKFAMLLAVLSMINSIEKHVLVSKEKDGEANLAYRKQYVLLYVCPLVPLSRNRA